MICNIEVAGQWSARQSRVSAPATSSKDSPQPQGKGDKHMSERMWSELREVYRRAECFPALLEALEAMSEMWVSVCSAVGHDPEHMTQYVRAIAAIQSAKGKA